MRKERRPSWQGVYDQLQQKKRERMQELAKTFRTYPQPRHDESVVYRAIDGKVALVDTRTGDFLIGCESDVERALMNYRFKTRTDALVCTFLVQIGRGYTDREEPVPYRIYRVAEAVHHTEEVREARKRVSVERFAEFMASHPYYVEYPAKSFVVIDAPLQPGERLL